MYARIENGVVVEFPIEDIRKRLPNVSFPVNITEDFELPSGFVFVRQIAAQPYSTETMKLVQGSAPVYANGCWGVGFKSVPLSIAELQGKTAQLREKRKQDRMEAVQQITVTTSAGNTYDGDETSQGRMARAVIALQATSAATTLWVLANNTTIQVTAAELTEAMVLAGQAQSAIWII